MSSNPLIDGLRRWRPTADWRCLANSHVAAQACVCRLWAVAWVVRRLSLVTWQHIRGGWSTRCAIQIDVLLSYLTFTCLSVCLYVYTEAFQTPIFATGPDRNGFNLGCRRNFLEIFGDDYRLWFVPKFTGYVTFIIYWRWHATCFAVQLTYADPPSKWKLPVI